MDWCVIWCCISCLRGEDTRGNDGFESNSYYAILEVSPDASVEECRSAFRRKSLQMHPDKLAQRGLQVHEQDWVKLREAYTVLSDPRRRALYDTLGESGLKILEDPSTVNPANVLRNFQRNHKDRYNLALKIIALFAVILALPSLFSLKCDGLLGRKIPWLLLWTPVWIWDGLWLAYLVYIVAVHKHTANIDDEDGVELGNIYTLGGGDNWTGENVATGAKSTTSMLKKLVSLLTAIIFIAFQGVLMAKLDGIVDYSWLQTFAPFFIHEAIVAVSLFQSVFCSEKKSLVSSLSALLRKDSSASAIELSSSADSLRDSIEGNDSWSRIEWIHKHLEEDFQHAWQQKEDRNSLLVNALRSWLMLFLAIKLDRIERISWFVVFLPIWIFIISQFVWSFFYMRWGLEMMEQDDMEGVPQSILELRQKHATQLRVTATAGCVAQSVVLLMSLLLFTRLQWATIYIPTYIIIIPVFIGIVFCCCGTLCSLLCLSLVDPDAIESSQSSGLRGAEQYQHNSDYESMRQEMRQEQQQKQRKQNHIYQQLRAEPSHLQKSRSPTTSTSRSLFEVNPASNSSTLLPVPSTMRTNTHAVQEASEAASNYGSFTEEVSCVPPTLSRCPNLTLRTRCRITLFISRDCQGSKQGDKVTYIMHACVCLLLKSN